MKKETIKKIVLAYSGGLDTSIIIPWLKENYNNPEIIAVAADVGQGDELEGLEEKALKTGASKLIIADLVDEMCDEIIVPSIMMGAKYEKYLLGTAFARPIIGKKLAEIALAEGADAIAHGCTGKGNDQVRFELAIQYFAPGMPVIAPWREWSIKSRDEEIDYAEAHNVPLKISRETNYSKDKNLWHLSRFSEEIIAWCSWEFKFVELDDAYATGSSIMPQKKNPDVAELVRGKTGRVYGDLMGLLTVMKSLPLAYNKDMQEDKEPVFDALDTLSQCIPVFTAMVDTMTVLPENMRTAAGKGFLNATDCADYLTKKGMPFRDAYKVSGQLVYLCTQKGCTLEDLSLTELKRLSPLFAPDVYEAISLDTCVSQRKSYGGPAPEQTAMQIAAIEGFLAAHTK